MLFFCYQQYQVDQTPGKLSEYVLGEPSDGSASADSYDTGDDAAEEDDDSSEESEEEE